MLFFFSQLWFSFILLFISISILPKAIMFIDGSRFTCLLHSQWRKLHIIHCLSTQNKRRKNLSTLNVLLFYNKMDSESIESLQYLVISISMSQKFQCTHTWLLMKKRCVSHKRPTWNLIWSKRVRQRARERETACNRFRMRNVYW